MVEEAKLFRCKICGDPYIGVAPPGRCPFCGAYQGFIIEAKDYNETFDIELTEQDKANVEKALQVEISNTLFYECSASKVEDEEGKNLFKALGKVEDEHASIWRKVLKLSKEDIKEMKKNNPENCSDVYIEDLKDSHEREERAIKFYKQAAAESSTDRLKQLFVALIQVETDHLNLSGERLK